VRADQGDKWWNKANDFLWALDITNLKMSAHAAVEWYFFPE